MHNQSDCFFLKVVFCFVLGSRVASDASAKESSRPRFTDQDCVPHGQTVEHEALRMVVCNRKIVLEKVEKTIFCAGPGVAVHVCHVLVQGGEV